VVQAKRYQGTLGLDAVQEASAARLFYGAVRAIVVTTSTFTAPAKTLAQTTGVELWDRYRLHEELDSVTARRNAAPTQRGLLWNGERRVDPLFARSARAVAAEGAASLSQVQRLFNVDSSRAGHILDQLAEHA